jgi:hypothetical protein
MPMSAEAFDGLCSVVTWNPAGARLLLGILREYRAWVRYKDDPYGPLHMILQEVAYVTTTPDGRVVATVPNPFPVEKSAACERFGREWLRRDFSKRELAGTIAAILVKRQDGDTEDTT